MLTKQERNDLFNSVDLRYLSGKQVPRSADQSVRIDCPIHGGKGDLGIFTNHAYCFSAKCGWSGGAFDTAAILLGLYSKSDPLWPSRHFKSIISKLQELKAGYVEPEVRAVLPPTESEMEKLLTKFTNTDVDWIDEWRGWPSGTASKAGLRCNRSAIAIPVRRSDGKLLTIRYRILPDFDDGTRPKYWGTAGANDDTILYGGNTLLSNKGSCIVLVEGEFDTLASQSAMVPTLSFANGAGWRPERRVRLDALLRKFQRLVIAYDQDAAGNNGVFGYTTPNGKQRPGLLSGVSDSRRISVAKWDPALGKDPNEFIKRNGAREWRHLIFRTMSTSHTW